jgi:hypothetical protein
MISPLSVPAGIAHKVGKSAAHDASSRQMFQADKQDAAG